MIQTKLELEPTETDERMTRVTEYLTEMIGLVEEADFAKVRGRSLQIMVELAAIQSSLAQLGNCLADRYCTEFPHMINLGEDEASVDVSIRFFGLQWEPAIKRWKKTVKNIKRIVERQKCDDMERLQDVMRAINRLDAEVGLHTEAVLSGRVKRRAAAATAADNSGPAADEGSGGSVKLSAAFLPLQRSESDGASVAKKTGKAKYRKTKTADLSSKAARLMGRDRKVNMLCRKEEAAKKENNNNNNMLDGGKSDGGDGQTSRKSSFIDQMSNLLKNIL